MTAPFIIFGLPRSRTAWLSRFLTYEDWICGHDELRHMRSFDDIRAWLSQPMVGSVETAAAPWFRMLTELMPGARVVVVRRPAADVFESLLRVPDVTFDRDELATMISRIDRKLDQIEARIPCLSVQFADLSEEATCAKVFEYCLGLPFDAAWWRDWAPVNVQVDFAAVVRHAAAFRTAMDKLALVAKHRSLAAMALRKPVSVDGMTLQTESIDDWFGDAQTLFAEHCCQVGESPDEWERKNWPMMRKLYDIGAMQIITARSNGRMFGYLMTLISPSLGTKGGTSATNTTFFASPDAPGIGVKLQRAALRELVTRGVDEVFWEAGTRGSGPRLPVMYRRLGASEHGHTFRLALKDAA